MSETENAQPIFRTPAMTVGSEAEWLSESRPMRVSGLLALLLGLFSFTALFGAPMMIVPVLAIVAGLVALRPYTGLEPTGYRMAKVALVLATLFGVWGTATRQFKHRTLADQANGFAIRWLELLAQGDIEVALELKKYPAQRQSATMSLPEYYRSSTEGTAFLQEFRENDTAVQLIDAGDTVRWEPFRATESYQFNGRQLTTTYWKDQTGSVNTPIRLTMEYLPPTADTPAQWLVDNVSFWFPSSGGN